MILITGATGNVGREAVLLAVSRGLDVRALTRDPDTADLPAGVNVVQGSPTDHDSFSAAMTGVDAVLLVVPDDGDVAAQVLAETLPRRAVLISSITARTRPALAAADEFRVQEHALRAAAPDTVVLRPGQFASNVIGWTSMIAEGTVTAPFGDVAIPVIDPADIAEVALLVLTEDGHAGMDYDLSGPARLSNRDQVQVLARSLDRPIAFVEQDPDDFAATNPWIPEPFVEYVLAVKGSPTDDELTIHPTVEALLGRPASPFSAWVSRHRSALT